MGKEDASRGRFVAVKVEGLFDEWYSPNIRNPYDDIPEYAEWYEDRIMELPPPVFIAELEDGNFISGHLDCLVDRLTCDEDCTDSDSASTEVEADIERALRGGIVFDRPYHGLRIRITPCRKGDVPAVSEKSLAAYGEWADVIRKRVKAI